jgi:hypothetical protein
MNTQKIILTNRIFPFPQEQVNNSVLGEGNDVKERFDKLVNSF